MVAEPSDEAFGGKAAAAALQLGFAQAVKVALGFVTTIVVARVLTPGDYGVIAMAAPVTAFIVLFHNLGLNQAVIQAREISREQLNALFWVNIFTSVVIAALMLLASPVAAWFYQDARAGYVVAASALGVLIGGTAMQHGALLNRDMRFRTLSRIDIATSVTGLAATMAAAFLLRSYWALWLGGMASAIVGTLLLWRASPWRPSGHASIAGTGSMLKFGAGITGFNILNFFSRNLDNVLIARFWGAGPLGLYDRAYRLMMFPLQNINAPLSQFMLPILAKLKDEPERFRRAYLLAVRSIQLAVIPGVAVALATSDRLIPFLLGPKWTAAGPIFFWLALAGLIQPLGNATGWLFITSGRTGELAKWGLVSSITVVIGFIIGLQWGPVGVAASVFIGSLITSPILYSWCVRGTSVRSSDLYLALVAPLTGTGIIYLLVKALEPHLPTVALLAVCLPSSYVIAIVIQSLMPSGRELLRTIHDLIVPGIRRAALADPNNAA